MCEHAEKSNIPTAPKLKSKKPDKLSPPPRAVDFPAPSDTKASFVLPRRNFSSHLLPPRITLYDEPIRSPECLPEPIVAIVADAAQKTSTPITSNQLNALQKALEDIVKPTCMRSESQEFLTILFVQLTNAGIDLSSVFIDEIKKGCRACIHSSTDDFTPEFLSQWSNINTDFTMKHGAPKNYQYNDLEQVMPLLTTDRVSTTNDPNGEMRGGAASLVLDRINDPFTLESLRQLLLDLNRIYSPQETFSYRHGFRYHTAQIGQGRDAIGTTPAIQVEDSVNQVIGEIINKLAPCDEQLKNIANLTDELLKTVISTAAMAYQLLISIHPFFNGNGRTCRMFANYILLHYHLLPATYSQEDAKQSMYQIDTKNPNNPQKAQNAIIRALDTSFETAPQ